MKPLISNALLACVLLVFLCFVFIMAYLGDWSSLGKHTLDFMAMFGFLLVVNRTTRSHTKAPNTSPPANAEFLFYLFLTPENCDAIVGDLEERYRLIHKKFGSRRANFWFWTQVLRSLGPIAWAWTKKFLMKPVVAVIAWAIGKGFMGHDSWLAALVELYRKIRS